MSRKKKKKRWTRWAGGRRKGTHSEGRRKEDLADILKKAGSALR